MKTWPVKHNSQNKAFTKYWLPKRLTLKSNPIAIYRWWKWVWRWDSERE